MRSVLRNSEEADVAKAKRVWQVSGRRQGELGGNKEANRVQATDKTASGSLLKLIP